MPYSVGANWKIAIENYLECYHCAVAHPGFSDVIDVTTAPTGSRSTRPSSATSRACARSRARSTTTRPATSRASSTSSGRTSRSTSCRAGPNISIGPIHPVGPERTDGYLDYFFSPGEDPAWIADYLDLDNQVGAEDRVLVESVQSGMRSGAFEKGQLLLPSEDLIKEFQRWVADGLNGDQASA